MVGSVVQGGLQVDHGVARQHAVDAGFPQALFHGGEEVLGHRAAHDLLAELQGLALAGLEADPHVAELAGAAGLLLVAALLGHRLADLLPVGHPGLGQLHLHVEAALELVHQHVHLDVAGGGDHHLVGLGVVHHVKGGVLLVEAAQARGDLVLLAPGLGGDGPGEVGLGKGDGIQLDELAGVAQGVAGLDAVHLADGADVAAAQLLDLLVLLAPHGVQAAQLLVLAGGGVHQGQVGGEAAGDDLDKGELAVLVGHGLEHEGGGDGALGDDEVLMLAILVGGGGGDALQGVGQQVHDEVQQHQGAQAGIGGAAHHGDQGAVPHAGAQALHDFGVGKALAGEELLHQLFAGLGHGFHELVVQLVHHALLVGGDGDLLALVAGGLKGALVDHVHHAGDLLVLVPDGDHHRGHALAEALPQGVEGGVEVDVVLVHFGDVDDAGQPALVQQPPGPLGAHGKAALGGAHQHPRVGHGQALGHLAGEVEVAGGVQHVDLAAVVLHGGHGGGDGDLALDLLGVVIANGVAVGGLAQTVDDTGHAQKALNQGGLAVAAMAQQADIADIMGRIAHSLFHSLTISARPRLGQSVTNDKYTINPGIWQRLFEENDESFFRAGSGIFPVHGRDGVVQYL